MTKKQLSKRWLLLKKTAKAHPYKALLYFAAIFLAATPLVIMFVLLVKYSVNIPWWDEMGFVDLMAKASSGHVTLYDLWRQHNEHRYVVMQSIQLAVGFFTGYNFRVIVIMNFFVASGSLALLLLMLKKTLASTRLVILMSIPFAWLMFSTIPWINWIWSYQLAFHLSIFFILLTIYLLTHAQNLVSNKLFVFSIIAAIAATYSVGSGFIIWVLGFGILLFRRADKRQLGYWAGSAIITIASYAYKFHRTGDSMPISQVIAEPIVVTRYVLIYLGKSFALSQQAAQNTGLVLVLIFLACTILAYRKKLLTQILPWLAIAVGVTMNALLGASSRLNFGLSHSFESHSYPTFSILFTIATMAMVAAVFQAWYKERNRANLHQYVAVAFALGILVALPIPAFTTNYLKGIEFLRGQSAHMHKSQACLYSATSETDDCLLFLVPSKEGAWQAIQQLRAMGWDGFKR